MAKPAAQAAAKRAPAQDEPPVPPKNNKKKLILIIAAVILLIAGGVVAFMLLKSAPPPKHGDAANKEAADDEKHTAAQPNFFDLGQFTANLIREDDERYVQVTISLKITKPELEEKIKAARPEIMHRVNMLLQSKRPSELSTFEGKEKLAQQIKAQTEFVLGLRKAAPDMNATHASAPAETGASKSGSADVKSGSGDAKSDAVVVKSGLADVLFTSFIIQ